MRLILDRFHDPVPGTLKVDIAERVIKSVDPEAQIGKVPDSMVSVEALNAIIGADYVFGC